MHIERALRVINLSDVPEAKRKFWPQHAVVVIGTQGEILDVIQHFEANIFDVTAAHRSLYPESTMFAAWPGLFAGVAELRARIENALQPPSPNTYVIGDGPR